MGIGARRYQKLFVGFFIAMLLLTGLSRGLDSIAVPRVSIEEPKPASLAYTASGSGRITAANKEYVRSQPEFFLKQVLVGNGQAVQAGDPLFVLEQESVEEQLIQQEKELESAKLNLNKAQLDRDGSAADQAAVEQGQIALERAKYNNEINLMFNEGKQMLADKRAIEDAEAELRSARMQLEENRVKSGMDLGLLRLEIQEKQKRVEQLRKISGDGGVIRAEFPATVGDLTAKAGQKTGEGSLCSLIPQGTSYLFEAEVSQEDGKYMKIGDEISVTLQGTNVPLQGVTIQSLQNSEEKTRITAELPADIETFNDMTATFSHKSITDAYQFTVPLDALRGSEGNYFVLLAEETNTVLGQQWKAKQQKVEVLAKDSTRAALNEPPGEGVIGKSNKPLAEGDRVREVYEQ